MSDSRSIPPFKLYAESLGLTVAQLGLLARLPRGSARKMARGVMSIPPSALQRIEHFITRVDDVADAYRHAPERADRAALPRILDRAVQRRIMEMNITQRKGGKHA